MLFAIAAVIGGLLGLGVGIRVGKEMADDFVYDWSDFGDFAKGCGCYLVWIVFGVTLGALTGPVSAPITILAGPAYFGHRWYFNRKKVRY